MSAGPRSQPPDLPNFEYRSWLGGGGFADVFLYQQLRPQRQVAVKVLRTVTLDAQDQRAFDAEANLMARVSAHPYIVTVYGADTAPDGRPFLVMEYFPKPHFGQRTRGPGLAVQEVLRVGVRVASAVETAHRAGILHHDIKPANILVSEYDRPGLTDFGIAGAQDGSDLAESQGVTIPYAPPEVLGGASTGDKAADVYSLGATLYSLLAGRAPFEVTGGDNGAQALLQRTLSTPVPPVGRSDVPRGLELLLAQSMAKDPKHRPVSAAAFARSLQGIERELQLAPTDFELAGDVLSGVAPVKPDGDDSTRSRIQVVRPTAPISEVPEGLTRVRGAVEPPVDPPVFAPAAPAASETVARLRAESASPDPSADAPPDAELSSWGGRSLVLAVAGGAALLAIVVGVVVVSGGEPPSDPTSTTASDDAVLAGIQDAPPVPTNVVVRVIDGVAGVTWEPGAAAEPGDIYKLRRTDTPDPSLAAREFDEPAASVEGVKAGEQPCFEVGAVRGNRGSDEYSDQGCA